jgi:transcription elongation factor Elf1
MSTKKWREANLEKIRQYRRKWYNKNKIVESAKQQSRKKARKPVIREWFVEFKKTLQCSECGENHIACLDFHHTDPRKKDYGISQMIDGNWSIKKINEEVAKCVVLCSNCHRKLHWENKIGA